STLIELHGQHEHQTLLDPSTHLTVLDDYAGLGDVRNGTAQAFAELCSSVRDSEAYKKSASERDGRREVLAFELKEIGRVGPRAGEEDELLRTREILANAERIERLCGEAYAALYERDNAVLSTLGAVWRRVAELADIDPQFKTHLDARDEIKARLEDLALLLRHYLGSEQPSQARLQEVEERLAALERLKRKYGLTLSAGLSRRHALRVEQSGP